jgi:mannose-6-phosphate isomerase-like protein (cupin superfamily)
MARVSRKWYSRDDCPPAERGNAIQHTSPDGEVIDEKALADACEFTWYNQTLCKVNDSVVRLGVVHGEYHWHKHDQDDEVFYVVDGRLLIDLEDRTVELSPRQGFVVPKGVMHRTRAQRRTVILMVEKRWDHTDRQLDFPPIAAQSYRFRPNYDPPGNNPVVQAECRFR